MNFAEIENIVFDSVREIESVVIGTGIVNNEGTIISSSESGFLFYGPYIDLDPGS